MMIHKISHSINITISGWNVWTFNLITTNQISSLQSCVQQIRQRYYETLVTSVINSPMSPPSLAFNIADLLYNSYICRRFNSCILFQCLTVTLLCLKNQPCDVINHLFFPTSTLISLIFMMSYGWFLRHFVKLLLNYFWMLSTLLFVCIMQ